MDEVITIEQEKGIGWYCPKCGKYRAGQNQKEAIQDLGMCLQCDHIMGDI